jgi:hypothetical protein
MIEDGEVPKERAIQEIEEVYDDGFDPRKIEWKVVPVSEIKSAESKKKGPYETANKDAKSEDNIKLFIYIIKHRDGWKPLDYHAYRYWLNGSYINRRRIPELAKFPLAVQNKQPVNVASTPPIDNRTKSQKENDEIDKILLEEQRMMTKLGLEG